ncbi:hypothetical protein [Billgrantia gudaonensis]|uniref:Uncharacterized protein n=1 Tax=Billgrantia gudaonensis TaxID=376427 RepID=A0A1G8R1W8_9GAMM|nr:hypothetical protein [Halomonas gudaonensis]SDJ10565.1 hypothetical protein SAMN04487954_10353 [Halomonas gudaonensis]
MNSDDDQAPPWARDLLDSAPSSATDEEQGSTWPPILRPPDLPVPSESGRRLSRKDRSVLNRQAYNAARLFEERERKRLRALPHLSKSEANRLAHQLGQSYYERERQRLLDLAGV